MTNFYCTLQVSLLVLLSTVSATPSSSQATFPKCDKKLIKEIKEFWSGAGTPTNILQQISENGPYINVLTSRIDKGSNYSKCISLTSSTNSSTLISTRTCKNPCNPPVVGTFAVEESDGVLSTVDGPIVRYFIFVANNVLALYLCNLDGFQGPPAGSIYTNEQGFNDTSTQSTRRSVEGLMDLLGFQYTYSYGPECF